MKPMSVYDGITRRRLCYLQNAFDISYSKTTSTLWTGAFSLPYDDPKNDYCKGMNLVDMWDIDGNGDDKYVGLFRIMPVESSRSMVDFVRTYTLEHVISTLIDDTLIGWHESGDFGTFTPTVIRYLLDHQEVKRWQLGVCDYNYQYLYGWQDENLLNALFSIPNAFQEDDFRWEFDTRTYPWTLHLRSVSENPIVDIRYRKNISGITRAEDPTNLVTRLYCYGYGDGDNKLTIASVNEDVPYLQSPNVDIYGLITKTWTDQRYTIPESLKNAGEKILSILDSPVIGFTVDISTVRRAANLEAGDMVRVVDDGWDIMTRVVLVEKSNVSGEPYKGSVQLANKSYDIAQSTADLVDQQRIANTYASGSESVYNGTYFENANPEYPAEITFDVPTDAIHVNEILMTCRVRDFRAFTTLSEGFVEGGKASTLQVFIDDTLVGEFGQEINEVNLIEHMQTNANGNIYRGQHTIKIVPDALTGIDCTIQIRLFTNSRGAGQH